MSAQREDEARFGAPLTVVRRKRFQLRPLPSRVAFWVAAAVACLIFAANTAASPLYRVYQSQFRFSAIRPPG